ncbi:hypothetical protein F5884DRAFT_229857 [Xylogone sp. PMI_703]|nr:hypothetical protein F5884DRAFT_229857 [Xylogone sp. PMI_703]
MEPIEPEQVTDFIVAKLHDPNLVPDLQERIDHEEHEIAQARSLLETAGPGVRYSTALTQFVVNRDELDTLGRNNLESGLQALDREKAYFLDKVQTKVYLYIKSLTRQDCLGIIETVTVDGNKVQERYTFARTADWSARFSIFTTGRDPTQPPHYEGNPLDSFLTEPVKEQVVNTMLQFYSENQAQLVDCLVNALVAIPVFRDTLKDHVKIYLAQVKPEIRPQEREELATIATDEILEQVGRSVFARDENNMTDRDSIAAGAIRATLAASIAAVVRDYLSRPEFRYQIDQLVSQAVSGTLIVTLISTLVTIGAITASSASLWWLIAPAVVGLGWMTYKALNLPDDLGQKVSKAISKRLDESFRLFNDEILSSIFKDTIRNRLDQVGRAIMGNEHVTHSIRISLQNRFLIED